MAEILHTRFSTGEAFFGAGVGFARDDKEQKAALFDLCGRVLLDPLRNRVSRCPGSAGEPGVDKESGKSLADPPATSQGE